MRIGGFVKQSFIDWEGKITSVIFTKGCNFRCGFCHNPSLVLPKLIEQTPDIEVAAITEHLRKRKQWLDGVVITGGEPTLHNDLSTFIKTIKELGYPVKLDTNGSNPTLLKKLIADNSVDYVAMDIKTTLK
ncbi:MAG TPA: anaerobic ribonucleoside-triphosphate reductase activating protein, partial [Perlabentimonas sp.]|nr:anaerobic ribonucleoside-triphosphate reductase activating protein [Perlabentimonas sp.]